MGIRTISPQLVMLLREVMETSGHEAYPTSSLFSAFCEMKYDHQLPVHLQLPHQPYYYQKPKQTLLLLFI